MINHDHTLEGTTATNFVAHAPTIWGSIEPVPEMNSHTAQSGWLQTNQSLQYRILSGVHNMHRMVLMGHGWTNGLQNVRYLSEGLSNAKRASNSRIPFPNPTIIAVQHP